VDELVSGQLVRGHRGACDGFSSVADAFAAERWSLPTPCTEWDARALVEHVIGFHEFLILRPLGIRANRPRDDPAARWRATAVALFAYLETDGALDRPTGLPGGGQSSPRQMLGALTTDVLVHTWDLARAGGLEPRLDRELCEAAYAAAHAAGLSRGDGMIGAEIAVPPGVNIETRLVALYGRDPAWRATP
jgi:uncharacterized protein (TIGR03086 family)